MRDVCVFILIFLGGVGAVLASTPPDRFKPVQGFEADRYLGLWYEIARMPNRFEKDLVKVTATYGLKDNGKLSVLNQGYTPDGKEKSARGKAKFAGSRDVGHLKVSFFGPFYGDYIIVELDQVDYRYALVVGGNTKYLWILSRTPRLDADIYQRLLEKGRELGFDIERIFKVPQE